MQGIAAFPGDLAAVFQVIFVDDLGLVALVFDVADIEHHGLAIRILGNRKHRVGRLTLIVPHKATTDRHGTGGMQLVVIDGPDGNV